MGLFQNTSFGQVAAPATNLIGSLINNYAAKQAQERENKANRQMAEYQYSKDLEMWNRQNEYNNPQSQMERFKAAGLNPNLIYGQGNAGNASTLPKYSAPTIKKRTGLPDIQGVIPAYQDYQLKQANIDVATEQSKLIQEKAASEAVNRAWMSTKQLQSDFNLKLDKTYEPDRREAQNYNMQQQGYLTYWQRKRQMQQHRTQRLYGDTLARYNWQIAKQKLQLLEKDNYYYFWKNVGSGIGRGVGNMFKFIKGKGFVPKKGVAPKLKTPTIPKGFNYNNRANRAFQQSVNPW